MIPTESSAANTSPDLNKSAKDSAPKSHSKLPINNFPHESLEKLLNPKVAVQNIDNLL